MRLSRIAREVRNHLDIYYYKEDGDYWIGTYGAVYVSPITGEISDEDYADNPRHSGQQARGKACE